MKRIRFGVITIGCSALLGLGWAAAETAVGPATVGDVSADESGARVGPSTVAVEPTSVAGRTVGPSHAEAGPVSVGTDGSARVAPTSACVSERESFFFGTVCNVGVDQEGVRANGSDATVGGTTACYHSFPPGIFCQAETPSAQVNDGAARVEPTASTGSTQASDSGVSVTEAEECYEVGADVACATTGRVAADDTGAQTTSSQVCVLPGRQDQVPCGTVEGEKIG